MEKGKYRVLLGSNFLLENPNLDSPDSSDEVSNLSGFSRTGSSIKPTENSSEEKQVDLTYCSKKDLITRTRKIMKT